MVKAEKNQERRVVLNTGFSEGKFTADILGCDGITTLELEADATPQEVAARLGVGVATGEDYARAHKFRKGPEIIIAQG